MSGPERRLILHIEDTGAIQVLVRRVLQRRPDLEVMTAGDGETGLRLAAERHPSLILLDVNLPDMRGDEVLAALRADPDQASVPVVMVSGDTSTRDQGRFRDLGAAAVLTKPFDPGHLLAVVEEHCAVAQPDGAGNASAAPRPEPPAQAGPSGGGGGGLHSLMRTFLAEASSMVGVLRQAIADGDAVTVASVAHSLAGSSGLFGAKEMHRLARGLEDHGHAGDLAAGAAEVDALDAEIGALERDLATHGG